MNKRFLRIICICVSLAVATALSVHAQAGAPGGPPSGGGAPGGSPPGGSAPSGLPPGGTPSAPPSGGVFGAPTSTGRPPGGPGGAPPSGSALSRPDMGSPHSSTARRSILQLGPVGRWWDDKKVTNAIGLRREQRRRMDDIFNANKPAILSSYKTFLKEQANLDAVSKDKHTDKSRLFAAIDAVSRARASLQKATAQMLLQIRQEMDQDQIKKLEKIH